MTVQRDRFEGEVRRPQPNWETAIDHLSSLAMFEMLQSLASLQAVLRDEVLRQARRILASLRGWVGACDRIDFAIDVIKDRKLTSWPKDLPDEQVEDARNFLITLLRPSKSQAGRVTYRTADAAGIAAVQEVNPISIAVKAEFSGAVYQLGSFFSFTPPKKGEATASDPNVPVPAGTTKVAIYHTHGAGYQNSSAAESFSIEDREISKQQSKRSGQLVFNYLGTPSGKVLKFIPKPNEAGIGNGSIARLR